MAWNPEPAVTVVLPAAGQARQILRAYFDDVATRYYGRQATEEEITAAMRDDPSDDLELPHGLLVGRPFPLSHGSPSRSLSICSSRPGKPLPIMRCGVSPDF